MSGNKEKIEIVGAGPAGLSAAIAAENNEKKVNVFEKQKQVGHRFHGDYQGLENWSSEQNVLEEFEALGIEPTFDHTPVNECVFWSADGEKFDFRSNEPLWYLVRRGPGEGTLDRALLEQAHEAGATIQFGKSKDHLPGGGVVTHGPRRADVIACGYVFVTDAADGCYSILSDDLAPSGYAYLLIAGGRGTVATCILTLIDSPSVYGRIHWTKPFFLSLLGLAVPGTAIAFALWFWLLRSSPLNTLNVFSFLTPLFAFGLGIVFYREHPGVVEITGSVVVLAGAWLATRRSIPNPLEIS